MDAFSSANSRDSSLDFTLAEIKELECMYKQVKEQSLDRLFCQELASSFSCSSIRAGKSVITWEQVLNWFETRHKKQLAKTKRLSSPAALKLVVDLSNATIADEAPEISLKPIGQSVEDLSELQFEAKSSRDSAWYDVASFLAYRVANSGELVARVRFAGFGKEDDEWVDVRTGIRERSIPLEPSECQKVKVGDLVLCFQEREDQAVYCDAYIVDIHRKMHDQNSCGCVFVVQYDHDKIEEKVHLGRICCRPAGSTLAITNTQQEMLRDENWKLSFLY
ncbi:hypothetical protein UlMin_018631 [Ulmus minor]